MRFKTLFGLALVALLAGTAFADTQATTTSLSVTAHQPEFAVPANFNGSWIGVEGYGDKANPNGLAVYRSVEAQKAAYTAAKKANDLKGKVENSFWTSIQAWAFNNYGNHLIHKFDASVKFDEKHNIINKDELRPDLLAAKESLQAGLAILDGATSLHADEGDAKVKAYVAENRDRAAARVKLDSNLLYVQRQLGEKEWPKKSEYAPAGSGREPQETVV